MESLASAFLTAPITYPQVPFGTTILDVGQYREYLGLTERDVDRAVEWATGDEDEIKLSDLAVVNARRVVDGIFRFWPQHFDVYPLDGGVAIDSETINRNFVMVVCKSDGSVTTMINVGTERLRKSWQMEKLESLIAFAGQYLAILYKMKGAVTLEHTSDSRGRRTSWKRSIHIYKTSSSSPLSRQQISYESVQGSYWQTHFSRQIEYCPENVGDRANSFDTGLAEPTSVPRLGGGTDDDRHGQGAQGGIEAYLL